VFSLNTQEKQCLPTGVALNTQSLFEYWRSIRGQEAVPCRSDVRPVAILPLLPNLMILEYRADGTLVFRLSGTACVEALGIDLTGMNLFDLISPHQRVEAGRRVNIVRNHPCGLLVQEKLRSRYNTPFVVEIIYLPLRDRTGQITQLLGSANVIDQGAKGSLTDAPAHMTAISAQFLDIGAGLPQAFPGEVRRAV
jgi:hypothetical protein